MSSSPANSRSIAGRLVLLFTIAAVLLLCAGLSLVYWIVVQHAYEEDNEVLADKANALRADVKTTGGPRVLAEELKTLRRGEPVSYLVRIVDSRGNVISESPEMSELLPANVFPLPNESLDLSKSHRAHGRLFACTAVTAIAADESYTIQVAQDRSGDEEFSAHFRWILAGVIAAGVVASTLIARTVTRRGLEPLVEMTRSLERVGPNRLHERVPQSGWPRELQPLVVAFDEMLDRLEDSFTRLSQFSADLAHELRTPIANLRGEAEVALRRERSPNEYREVIESSVAECERLSGMIDSLLFLARAETAERTVERSTFDGRAAIAKIADYYHTIAEERDISIECVGEGQINADPLLFARAISNLVDNSLRYTADGGAIHVGIARRNGAAEVTVRDNGSGIPAEHLAKVFDRFYRVDSSRSSAGTGLGLALVESIAKLHGGEAKVESAPGKGTAVTMTFPANEASPGS